MATVEMTAANFDELVASNEVVLIDFWASWCGPCRTYGPVFSKASEQYEDVLFAKLDTEAQQELAARFGIRSIPTTAFIRDGVALHMQPGAIPENAIHDLVKQVKALNMDEVRQKIAEAKQG